MYADFKPVDLRPAIADCWANMAKIIWKQNLKFIEAQLGLMAKLNPRN